MARLWLRDDDGPPRARCAACDATPGDGAGWSNLPGPAVPTIRQLTGNRGAPLSRGSVVTSSEDGERRTGADAGEPSPPYVVPRHITRAGRQVFDDIVREGAARLAQQLEVEADRAHRTDPQYTSDDVHAARLACEQRIREQAGVDDADRRVLAAILLTVATVGVSAMANFLHSEWQILAFAALVIVGIVGLAMTWTSRR